MIFELARDFADALAAMPREHQKRRALELFEEAIRRDIHFIDRHPTTLFQCMWNLCWWYDCPEAAVHYMEPEGGWTEPPPWAGRERNRLASLLERWRKEKGARQIPSRWLRSLRPPAIHLGTAQLMVLHGYLQLFSSVAYSPAGDQFASACWDSVLVWDSVTGEELRRLRGHERSVDSVAYSPDGARIASGSSDGTVRVWDAITGEELRRLHGHELSYLSVAWSPDGNRIVSGSSDKTVRVWDAVTGEELCCLRRHSGGVTSVAWSPDGTRIVFGGPNLGRRVPLPARSRERCQKRGIFSGWNPNHLRIVG
jgi:hypothetical protein